MIKCLAERRRALRRKLQCVPRSTIALPAARINMDVFTKSVFFFEVTESERRPWNQSALGSQERACGWSQSIIIKGLDVYSLRDLFTPTGRWWPGRRPSGVVQNWRGGILTRESVKNTKRTTQIHPRMEFYINTYKTSARENNSRFLRVSRATARKCQRPV